MSKYRNPNDKNCNVSPVKEDKSCKTKPEDRCQKNGHGNKKKENKKQEDRNQEHHQYGLMAAAAACKPQEHKNEGNNNKHQKHNDKDDKFEFCNDKVHNGKDESHNNHSNKPSKDDHSRNDWKNDHKDDKDCDPKSHTPKHSDPKNCDPKPTHEKDCEYKPPVVNPCAPKPPVECKPILKLNPEPCCATPLNNINEDLQGATYQLQNLLLNDSSTGGAAIKIVAASLSVMGPGISIHAGSSTLGAANGFKTFEVKHEGYKATFKVYTDGKFELFGDINNTFNYLAEGQKLEFKLNYSVSNGYECKQTYAEVCIKGKNDCPIVCVEDMYLELRGCNDCKDDGQLKDSSKVILKDVDCGDCVTFSVKFEGLKADCADCIKEIKCDSFTAKELQKGVNIGDYFILKMVDGKLCAIALPNTAASKALAEGQTIEFKFSGVGTDKAGCAVKDAFKVTLKGANDAPELCINHVDRSIQLPDCDPCDNTRTDLCAGFNVSVKDVDCDDSYTLKFESEGVKFSCGDCKYEIKPFCYTAEQLSGNGVEIGKGIFLSFNNGKAEIKADANNPDLRKLGDDDILKLNIKVTATDKEGCKDVENVCIDIKGGNDKPELCLTHIDSCIQLPDCHGEKTDLCAGFNVSVKDIDCDDSYTLKFESDGVNFSCGDCKYEIKPFCYTAEQLCGKGVEIGKGIFLSFNNGKAEIKADANNPDLRKLGDDDVLKLNIKVTATDKAGCHDVETVCVDIKGGNDKPEVKIGDMCIQLPDCCENDEPKVVDCTPVCLSDPDCGDQACLVKIEFAGFVDEHCGICIPPACYTAAELEAGVKIDGLGTLTYADGKLTFEACPESETSVKLGKGDVATLCFTATAIDKNGCDACDRFDISIKGGNDAPDVKIGDMCIQLPDCCENDEPKVVDCTPVCLSDPDCGDQACLVKIEFAGYEDRECGIFIPPACYTAAELEAGVKIDGLGTLTYHDGKLTFEACPESESSVKLGKGDVATLCFTATAVDKNGCDAEDRFDISIKGGNDAPDVKIGDMCIQLPDCCEGDKPQLVDCTPVCLSDPDCGDQACLVKIEFAGYVDRECGIFIPPACYTAAELEAGVKIDGLGTLTYHDGKLTFEACPESETSVKLGKGDVATLCFTATAVDKNGCDAEDRFDISIKGGNDAPDVKIGDMCIQLPDCCDENPADNVCTDVIVCDPDCGDDAALAKVLLYGFGEDVEKGDPIACYTVEDLMAGVDVCGYGTLYYENGKICFDVNEENQDLKQLKDGEKFTIAFGAFAFDGDCYSEQDCFNIDIKGGNDGPTDGDELCEDGTGPTIGENGSIVVGDMNLLLNASDPENDPLHVSAVAVPIITGDYSPGEITVSAFDPNAPFTYTITSASGTSLLTVGDNGDVTLVQTSGKGAFDFLNDGEHLKISFDYTVSDGKCTDDSKAEICIDGEDDDKFYIPDNFSNLVLYMYDPDYDWQSGDASDKDAVLKVIFDSGSGSLPALDTNGDGYIGSTEIEDYIANDPNNILGDHTELIAFSLHNGNFAGETPYNTGYEPNNGTDIGNTNGDILKAGEGQLVFMDDSGFEVSGTIPPVPPSDDLTAANAWLDTLQQDVVFSPQLAGQSSYTSAVLAGTILDPATALGAAILANNPVDG